MRLSALANGLFMSTHAAPCRASEYITMALAAEPESTAAAFIALKVALQQGNAESAAGLIHRMAALPDMDPSFLRVSPAGRRFDVGRYCSVEWISYRIGMAVDTIACWPQ